MLISKSVINENARKHIFRYLETHFKYEERSDLYSVLSEILNDRDVFTYLAVFLKKDKGLKIGTMNYWDDIRVNVTYGLIIDFDCAPRKTKLFTYTDYGTCFKRDITLGFSFPDIYTTRQITPSPQTLFIEVNDAITHIEDHLTNLDLSTCEASWRLGGI